MGERDETVVRAVAERLTGTWPGWFRHHTDAADAMAEAAYDAAVDAGMVPPDEVAVRSDADGRLHVSTLMRERNAFQAEAVRLREGVRTIAGHADNLTHLPATVVASDLWALIDDDGDTDVDL